MFIYALRRQIYKLILCYNYSSVFNYFLLPIKYEKYLIYRYFHKLRQPLSVSIFKQELELKVNKTN